MRKTVVRVLLAFVPIIAVLCSRVPSVALAGDDEDTTYSAHFCVSMDGQYSPTVSREGEKLPLILNLENFYNAVVCPIVQVNDSLGTRFPYRGKVALYVSHPTIPAFCRFTTRDSNGISYNGEWAPASGSGLHNVTLYPPNSGVPSGYNPEAWAIQCITLVAYYNNERPKVFSYSVDASSD